MKKGYAQTSMREISKATGIDIRNLYYFIKSKEEILFLVIEMIHRREIELFEKQGFMSIDDPVSQLRTVIREFMDSGYDYGRGNPSFVPGIEIASQSSAQNYSLQGKSGCHPNRRDFKERHRRERFFNLKTLLLQPT